MDDELRKLMKQEIKATIKEVVNGKIDKLGKIQNDHALADLEYQRKDMAFKEQDAVFKEEIRQHMKETRPYMQGAAGLGFVWKILIGIGAALVAWNTIKTTFHF
jgi:hypothetical protein